MKKLILLIVFTLFLIPLVSAQKVVRIEIDGPITKGTLELFQSSLEYAKEIDAEALLVTLDTPGGGLAETLDIIKLIDRSEIPVISYVNPTGATAWSAGTMILVSSHVAAMTPNTVIGSAQPASISFTGFTTINESKIINALTALIAEKARVHGRDENVSIAFIRENLNLNPEEAKEKNVIEYIASDTDDLLSQVHRLRLDSTIKKTLNTKDAEIIDYKPSLRIKFLNIVTNPSLASVLLLIGVYALIFGLNSPGMGSEILGILLIGLGLIGTGFNISLVAVFFMILGVALLLIELNTPSFGILGIAGIISLVIGSILLVPTSFPNYFISRDFQKSLIISIVSPSVILAVILAFAMYKVMEIRKKKPFIGNMIGEQAVVTDKIAPRKKGFIRYRGEIWQASSDKLLKKGVKVKITGKKGPVLQVKKL